MPYPHEHSARIREPEEYDEFRRQNNWRGRGVHAIWGIKLRPRRKAELQAIRFDAKIFTVERAKKWLADRKIKYISFEPATGEKEENSAERIADAPGYGVLAKLDAGLRSFAVARENLECRIGGVALREAAEDEKDQAGIPFRMVAHGGSVMQHPFWGRWALDVSGMQVPKKPMPVLREHDPQRIVGHTTRVQKTKEHQLLVDGIADGFTEAGREVQERLRAGYPWQASIFVVPTAIERVEPECEVEVNGKILEGPGTVFRKMRLREVSFCALGADEETSAEALSGDLEGVRLFVELSKGKETGMPKITKTLEDGTEVELTLEQLKAESPEIYAAAAAEGRAEGVDAERKRIRAIQQLGLSDQEALTTKLIDDSATIEQATAALFADLKERKAELLKQLRESAPQVPADADPDAARAEKAKAQAEKEQLASDPQAALHKLALEYQRVHGGDYQAACRAVLTSQAELADADRQRRFDALTRRKEKKE